MSGDNPYGFEPWIGARANGPQTPVLPSPRTPLDCERLGARHVTTARRTVRRCVEDGA